MVTELEERVATLEANLEQALSVGMAHGDQHWAEGSDPAPGFFISVLTANDLPTTRAAETLYKVTGPPVLLYMVGPDGQREIGWSAHAACTVKLTLTTTHVAEANAADITGATVTLPKPGNYTIICVFDFLSLVGVASSAVGILREADDTVVDTPRGAIYNPGATGDRATVTQTYRFTTTTDDEVLKLSAYQTASVTNSFDVNVVHTTILAHSGLGGDTTSASHTHTHTQATSQTKGDHHTALTSLDIGGVPIVPDTGDAINIVAGANISLTPATNELTITSTGGGGSGPHTLLSTTHTDTDAVQAGSTGDIIIRNSINQWDNLAHPGVANSFLISGDPNPQWLPSSIVAAALAAAMDHDQLGGLSDNDHVIYPTKNGVELITGLWQFDREMNLNAISPPSSPPINSGVLYTEVSGTDILLRWKSPTGAVCTICTEANTSITATVSFLMMGIKQA